MTIIFDFNRTLFNPDTRALMPGAFELLQGLFTQGHTLALISRLEADREDTFRNLKIEQFFSSVEFVEEKGEALKKIITASLPPVYVVGDHLHDEIRAANRLGAKTIWFKRGRFANLVPEEKDDEPWRVIDDLMQVKGLID
ncbi:MAG: HAD hydrolase-like protein [Patescibacteria group bacterium]